MLNPKNCREKLGFQVFPHSCEAQVDIWWPFSFQTFTLIVLKFNFCECCGSDNGEITFDLGSTFSPIFFLSFRSPLQPSQNLPRIIEKQFRVKLWQKIDPCCALDLFSHLLISPAPKQSVFSLDRRRHGADWTIGRSEFSRRGSEQLKLKIARILFLELLKNEIESGKNRTFLKTENFVAVFFQDSSNLVQRNLVFPITYLISFPSSSQF